MVSKLKTHETSRLLSLGERLRENPRTILFSIPIFLIGALWFSFKKDSERISGSWGHLGISFKNYYKHRLKLRLLLRLAAECFSRSLQYSPLKDKPTVLLKLGQTQIELGDVKAGEKVFNEAIKIAKDLKDYPQLGYVLSHRGKLYVLQKKMDLAWQDFQRALEYIEEGVEKKKDSLYYQIWFSGLELEIANYYLELGQKEEAEQWIVKAKQRAEKYKLETRKLDVLKMMGKIEKLMSIVISILHFSLLRRNFV